MADGFSRYVKKEPLHSQCTLPSVKMEPLGSPGINNNMILKPAAIPILLLPSTSIPVTSGGPNTDLEKRYLQLSQENAILREQNKHNINIINSQTKKIQLLESKLVETDTKLNEKVTNLESDLETANNNLDGKNAEIKQLLNNLSSLLSKTQLEVLKQKKDKIHWTAEDMAKAFTIYYFSKKCYLYLKHNLKYPLPNISTVENWASRNKVVLRIPAYEILNGLKSVQENSGRKRKR